MNGLNNKKYINLRANLTVIGCESKIYVMRRMDLKVQR